MAARCDEGRAQETAAGQAEEQKQGGELAPDPGPECAVIRIDDPHEKENMSQKIFLSVPSSDVYNTHECVAKDRIGLQQTNSERGSKDGSLVSVVFNGLVTRESCCIFTCELLKHILHQRQQLPLPYKQLPNFYIKHQQGDEACQKKAQSKELADHRKCQRVLADLDEILENLEKMFSLTIVPCVLILLGGSTVCPKELYEINMESVLSGNAEQSLPTPFCLRQLFHSLFDADAFSEFKSSPIMGAVVMVLGHRNCGSDWFRPKLNYKVPTRCKKLLVNLSSSPKFSHLAQSPQQTRRSSDDDYVWFQAPVTLKGFHD